MKSTAPSYLKHHFLIAMPQMADPNFAQTLIYLIEHGPEGAMGLIVNRPSGLSLADVLEQLRPDEPIPALCQSLPIFAGGPVSQDVLFAIADGQGPQRHFVALGYAGWEAGQLEAELADNTWLSCPADPQILFDLPHDQRLQAAAASLGVDLRLLSTQVGHA